MQLADFIESQPFALKPRDKTYHEWKSVLRKACRELQISGEKSHLRQVITYLTSIVQKRTDVHHSPSANQGVCELYWFHKIRLMQAEADSEFSTSSLLVLTYALQGKIDLVRQAVDSPSEYGSRTILFINAWLEALEAVDKKDEFRL